MDLFPTKTSDHSARPRERKNLDRSAMGGFCIVAGVGFISTLNNIRSEFEKGFIHGWGKPDQAPFRDIHKEYDTKFIDNLENFMKSEKTHVDAKNYQTERIKIAQAKRAKTADILLKEFDIPTHGVSGWTESNWKRFWQLGNKTKVAAGASAVGLGVVTWVGYTLMRHTKYTLDEIDAKLDEKLGKIELRPDTHSR